VLPSGSLGNGVAIAVSGPRVRANWTNHGSGFSRIDRHSSWGGDLLVDPAFVVPVTPES
jgi:hypothetical protein